MLIILPAVSPWGMVYWDVFKGNIGPHFAKDSHWALWGLQSSVVVMEVISALFRPHLKCLLENVQAGIPLFCKLSVLKLDFPVNRTVGAVSFVCVLTKLFFPSPRKRTHAQNNMHTYVLKCMYGMHTHTTGASVCLCSTESHRYPLGLGFVWTIDLKAKL